MLILLDLPRRKEPFHGRHDICIVQQITTLLQVITKFNGHHNLCARRIASRPTTPTLLRTYVKAEEGKSVASSKNFGNSFALSCSDLRYCSDVPRARARAQVFWPFNRDAGKFFLCFSKGNKLVLATSSAYFLRAFDSSLLSATRRPLSVALIRSMSCARFGDFCIKDTLHR